MNDLEKQAEELAEKFLKEKVVTILNEMIKLCKPVKYKDFNKVLPAVDPLKLIAYEKDHQEVGYVYVKDGQVSYEKSEDIAITTLSLIATLTDILIKDRLAFNVEDDDTIIGVSWNKENTKEKE